MTPSQVFENADTQPKGAWSKGGKRLAFKLRTTPRTKIRGTVVYFTFILFSVTGNSAGQLHFWEIPLEPTAAAKRKRATAKDSPAAVVKKSEVSEPITAPQ
jgi:hypothetical protein